MSDSGLSIFDDDEPDTGDAATEDQTRSTKTAGAGTAAGKGAGKGAGKSGDPRALFA